MTYSLTEGAMRYRARDVRVVTAMAMLESATEMPSAIETCGLQTFPVTDVIVEVQGGDVLILAGEKRSDYVNWTHFCRIPAASLLKVFPLFEKAAILAMTVAGAVTADGMILPH